MKKRRNLAPYLLILPSFLYLAVFFAWPMLRSLQLAFQRDEKILVLRASPNDENADETGRLEMNTTVTISEREKYDEVLPNGRTRPYYWFNVSGADVNGNTVTGWTERKNLDVKSAASSEEARVRNGDPVKEWTLANIKRMVNDGRFSEALTTTLLLMVIILPIQFVLAIIMALVLQSQLKFNSIFLYIYAIPLGISDLAAGLVWEAMFKQNGFLNSFLVKIGVIDKPYIFLSADNKKWMITAIVLAEIWRATSIVMVIVVSGLQAIPRDYMEAGEIFGANLWQRLRHIILPLLKPSLQVALILRTILAFQVFAVVVAISGGRVLTVLAYETYRWYDPSDTGFNNPNVASAYAGLIMLLSLIISIVYLRAVRAQEEAAQE
ncbi:MAG TPA: sugar ABC transporter permease [Aggregatilineaceae bacterium]|nr:sugar ABC transporter permease [Aggregatilineaceae bacterium]